MINDIKEFKDGPKYFTDKKYTIFIFITLHAHTLRQKAVGIKLFLLIKYKARASNCMWNLLRLS